MKEKIKDTIVDLLLDGVIRKIVRNNVDHTKPMRLYDLDYDIQLNAALDIIKNENFTELMTSSKTLAEMQE